jgi:cytochrome c biogenesis protein CcdA
MNTEVNRNMEVEQNEKTLNFDEVRDDLRYPEIINEEPKLPSNASQNQANQESIRKGSFANGISVGLGLGVISCFATVWASLFFGPSLAQSVTYESLLASFIYVLIFLLGIGLVMLTAGAVREHYAR